MYFDWGLDEYLHNRDADRNLSDPVSGDGGRSGGDSGRHQDRAFDGRLGRWLFWDSVYPLAGQCLLIR